MILYHGSKEIVEFPEIRKAVYNKDFYFGFYCTRMQEQAERWATRYGRKGYVNCYEYIPDKKLKYLIFEEMTEEWLDFIVACRSGQSHDYDIVEGPMADDTIYNYVQNFIDGKISRAAFWELVKFNHPTHQISFHTISALDTLQYVGSEAVNGNKNNNNLFFTCSLIEYMGRLKKKTRCEITEALGKENIDRIYEYADVLHCEPIEKVAHEFVTECKITTGNFDNVIECRYRIPDYWDIGEVYERLIEDSYKDSDILKGLWEVYHSWIDEKISDYNTDFYYQPRDYIAACYKKGEVL